MICNIPRLLKGSPPTQSARRTAIDLLNTALSAVNPRLLVQEALKLKKRTLHFANSSLSLDDINGIYVIGAGKATGRMAEAVETLLKDYISGGLIIVPETTINDYTLDYLQIQGGGHPKPNTKSVTATQHLIDLISRTPLDALIVSLFSGGGSSLLTLPTSPLTLKDLQQTTTLLLHTGVPIQQINTVRKHLSQIKGGQLATHIHTRLHWSLLISDIPDDRMDMIASGPTLPDPTTFSDVATIFDNHQIWDKVPASVRQHITAGVQGRLRETPKPNDSIFEHSIHQLIGSNQDACNAVIFHANREKYTTKILTTTCQGEARVVGGKLGCLANSLTTETQPQVLIVGSETTVMVRHKGKGGRNTELITAALPYLDGTKGLVIASLATDGIDGPTDAAGAIADGDSYKRAHAFHLNPMELLDANNTYPLFQTLEDLLITGPTHTNVRDITIIVWKGSTR